MRFIYLNHTIVIILKDTVHETSGFMNVSIGMQHVNKVSPRKGRVRE